MEKVSAHCRLDVVKAAVADQGLSVFTRTALEGIDAMGMTHADAIAVVLRLTVRMFYKSMTTHSDHRVWQDVYHAPCPEFDKVAYIKVTVRAGATVIQFKER